MDPRIPYSRHAAYFRDKAAQITSALDRGGATGLITAADSVWQNIERGSKWARDHSKIDVPTGKLCIDYLRVTGSLLSLRHRPSTLLEWGDAAWEAAHRLQDYEACATALYFQGQAYRLLGDDDAAAERFTAAVELVDAHSLHEHPIALAVTYGLGIMRSRKRQDAEAESLLHKALALSESSIRNREANLVICLKDLAEFYYRRGSVSAALPLAERAVAIGTALGVDHPNSAAALHILSWIAQVERRWDDAVASLEQACSIWERVFGPGHPDTLGGIRELAMLQLGQGQLSQAEGLILRYLTQVKGELEPEKFDMELARISLEPMQAGQEGRLQIVALLQRLTNHVEAAYEPIDPELARSLQYIAWVYSAMCEYGEAERLLQRSFAAYENVLGPEHPRTVASFNDLVDAFQRANEFGPVPPGGLRILTIPTLKGERFVFVHPR